MLRDHTSDYFESFTKTELDLPEDPEYPEGPDDPEPQWPITEEQKQPKEKQLKSYACESVQ